MIEAYGQIVNLPLAASSTQLCIMRTHAVPMFAVPRQSQHVCSAELFLYFDIMKHDVMLRISHGIPTPMRSSSIGTCKNRKSAWHGDCGPDVDILAVTRGMSHACDPVLLVPQWERVLFEPKHTRAGFDRQIRRMGHLYRPQVRTPSFCFRIVMRSGFIQGRPKCKVGEPHRPIRHSSWMMPLPLYTLLPHAFERARIC
ncbi:hypothetical protein BC629DRAFT_940248 [Irpex lacteus]|nr:hypothetical protein BC629DRAFT_940248 [Irpex lacteus]